MDIDDLTPEMLLHLRKKAEKATKGNWFVTCNNKMETVINCVALDRYESRIAKFQDNPYAERNADFIAAANPDMILAMIAKIEWLEKEVNHLIVALSKNV